MRFVFDDKDIILPCELIFFVSVVDDTDKLFWSDDFLWHYLILIVDCIQEQSIKIDFVEWSWVSCNGVDIAVPELE